MPPSIFNPPKTHKVHPCTMTDAITQRDIAHAAFAQFIADSSDAIHESYWFSIRGECESSLCMHSMLTMDEFCRLLYIADLVQIGKRGAQLSRNIWAQFLRDEQLLIDGDVEGSEAEVEKGQVELNNLKTIKQPCRTRRMDLLFLLSPDRHL